MYCVNGASGSYLLIESTDSMIHYIFATTGPYAVLREKYEVSIILLIVLQVQWNLIITVTLVPNLAGCYIEVAFLLSGIQNHHN